jgi:hypothetical protein
MTEPGGSGGRGVNRLGRRALARSGHDLDRGRGITVGCTSQRRVHGSKQGARGLVMRTGLARLVGWLASPGDDPLAHHLG